MWYAFICTDHPDSLAKRVASRPAHLARLTQLQAEGRLFTAGPFPAVDSPDPGEAGFSGSLIIADFPSLDEAKAWAAVEPYLAAGVYSEVLVKPYKLVFPT